ncbi:MAG: CHY zinc finger protein [Salinibacter sp.]
MSPAPSSPRTTHAPALDDRFDVPLRGVAVDLNTRCAHYDGPHDIIALRGPCCEVYYPCHKCHRAVADHDPARWPRARWDEPAVLCGACGHTISAATYLHTGPACVHCGAAFNPGCAAHHNYYFDVDA